MGFRNHFYSGTYASFQGFQRRVPAFRATYQTYTYSSPCNVYCVTHATVRRMWPQVAIHNGSFTI